MLLNYDILITSYLWLVLLIETISRSIRTQFRHDIASWWYGQLSKLMDHKVNWRMSDTFNVPRKFWDSMEKCDLYARTKKTSNFSKNWLNVEQDFSFCLFILFARRISPKNRWRNVVKKYSLPNERTLIIHHVTFFNSYFLFICMTNARMFYWFFVIQHINIVEI